MNVNPKRFEKGKYWQRALSLVEGCTPVSPACDNCWLKGMHDRFVPDEDFWGNVRAREDRLELPLKTKKPTVWAVWSDLLHESISADFITHAFEVMEACPQHTFLVLTKRPERLEPVLYGQEGNFFLGGGDYIKNVWLGTTVENQEWANKRIPHLLKCWPFKLFLSVEPILAPIKTRGTWCGIDWIILGCESGPKRRPAKIGWFRNIARQCRAAEVEVPLFVKQIEINGRVSHDMSEWPEDLRIREMPNVN